ncbi:MAG: SRPBCC domain-containing protein [Rhodoferax sp.]|nr:SRPBCC domain-containing protein [Rhodoferax sp.]
MDTTQTEISPTADRELVVSRLIDAPAALVFNAWIEPKQLEQWWGPNGFQTTVHEMEVRPQGNTRLVMQGPDGEDYPNKLVYTEIKAAKVLSYMQSDDSDSDNDAADFGVTVQFEEEDNQTRVTVHTLFKTAAERQRVVEEVDAISGANQTLERLEKFLKEFLPPHKARAA